MGKFICGLSSVVGVINSLPLTLKLVNASPRINGTTVSVEVSVSGPVNKVICSLDEKTVEEDCKLVQRIFVYKL